MCKLLVNMSKNKKTQAKFVILFIFLYLPCINYFSENGTFSIYCGQLHFFISQFETMVLDVGKFLTSEVSCQPKKEYTNSADTEAV